MLTKSEIKVYRVLEWFKKKYGTIFPAVAKIAAMASISRSYAVRCLNRLTAIGYIRRTPRFDLDAQGNFKQESNVYELLKPVDAESTPYKESFKNPKTKEPKKNPPTPQGPDVYAMFKNMAKRYNFTRHMVKTVLERIGNVYGYTVEAMERAWKICKFQLQKRKMLWNMAAFFAEVLRRERIRETMLTERVSSGEIRRKRRRGKPVIPHITEETEFKPLDRSTMERLRHKMQLLEGGETDVLRQRRE